MLFRSSDDTVGNNYPVNDNNDYTIQSSTHGVDPTIFTVTPTVVGDTVSYAWTTGGYSFTGGTGGSTAGTVTFNKDYKGTTLQTLTVSGNGTSANAAVSIATQEVQKAVTGGTKPSTLRAGTTFSVTNISTNYTQNLKLVRDGFDIGAAESVQGTMHFSISATNDYTNNYDSNNVDTYLTDSDHTAITYNLGTTVMLPPLPIITGYTVVQDTAGYLRKIDVAWTTTHATDVTIDQGVGSQAANGSYQKSGLSHGTAYTFNITAYNAPDEPVATSAAASTIAPSVSISTESETSFTYGETGTYTVAFTKNFKDAVYVHSGYGLNASETGGTEMQRLSLHGLGATSFTATFNKNYFGAGSEGSDFGTVNVIDYRVGSSDAGWWHFNQNRALTDFSTSGTPTSLASGTVTGTAIQMTWSYSAGAQTGIQINYGEASPSDWLSTVNITNGASSVDITDLDEGTTYQFRARTYTTKTTTPDGGSESRTNYSYWTSTVNVTTIGWSSIVLDGNSMNGSNGTGYSTPEAAHLSNDEQNTAYYLDTQTLGTHTVDLKRAVDSAQAWDGNGHWYGVGAIGDRSAVAFVRNNTGDILASQYHLVAHTPPLDPTGMVIDNVTTTSMTLNWSCLSTIESGFKIYHRTGGLATKDNASLLDTLPANTTSYTATGLSSDTEHYFAVYAYRGDGFSGVLQGNEGTLAAPTWSNVPTDFNINAYIDSADCAAGYESVSKTITLANGVGNTTVTLTQDNGSVLDYGVALSTSGDPGVCGTSNSGTGFGTSKSISFTSGTLYMRFRHKWRSTFVGADANVSVTFTNYGVSNTALDITMINYPDTTTETIDSVTFDQSTYVEGEGARVTYTSTNLGGEFFTIDLYRGGVKQGSSLTTTAIGGDTYKDVTLPTGLSTYSSYAFHVFKTGDTSVNRTSSTFTINATSLSDNSPSDWSYATSPGSQTRDLTFTITNPNPDGATATITFEDGFPYLYDSLGESTTSPGACYAYSTSGFGSLSAYKTSDTSIGSFTGTNVYVRAKIQYDEDVYDGGTKFYLAYNGRSIDDIFTYIIEGCFDLTSPILLSDGSTKQLHQIRIGDVVKSWNIPTMPDTDNKSDYMNWTSNYITGSTETTSVVTTTHFSASFDNYWYINSGSNYEFKVSSAHGIFVKDNTDTYKFKYANELTTNDKLFDSNLDEVDIISIETVSGSLNAGWIDVEDADVNYYAGILAHNKCFVEGTLVSMADGTQLPIEDIKIGDLIQTYDTITTEIRNTKVMSVANPIHDDIVFINFSNGITNENTFDHPYYVKDRGWCSYSPQLTKERYNIETNLLEIGDICYYGNELEEVTVKYIREELGNRQTYTIDKLEYGNTFFANGIVVHNEGI